MNQEIVVSILCITYNQAKYVGDMLEGFLEQETDFNFEILVHDDASTDETLNILKDYEARYSNIKVYAEKTNRFAEGINYINEILLPDAKGRFVAICEGDDYWCSRDKLQKQVDYMEAHPDCALCTHAARVISGVDSSLLGSMGLGNENRILTALDLARNWHLPTASFLFRKEDALSYAKEWRFKTPVGDFPRAFYLATKGSVSYIAEEMSVYRFGVPGSWTSLNDNDERRLVEGGLAWLSMLDDIDVVTKHRYQGALIESGKSKVIRLRSRGVTDCFSSHIANLALEALSRKQRMMCAALGLFWKLGFDLQRRAWSGNKQWCIVKRASR